MATTPAQAVKELRDLTGLGMMECKKILEEAGGDFNKAKDLCVKRGQDRAAKLAEKAATEGIISIYHHHDGKLAVMVELRCNTDFVARGEPFKNLAKELAMHIAAMSPQVVERNELDASVVEAVRAHKATEVPGNKPKEFIDKIVDGKMGSWYEERVLLDQKWVKDPSKTIRQLIQDLIATTKENITVGRFARFKVGEGDAPASEAAAG